MSSAIVPPGCDRQFSRNSFHDGSKPAASYSVSAEGTRGLNDSMNRYVNLIALAMMRIEYKNTADI
jgi:hypothetical protein